MHPELFHVPFVHLTIKSYGLMMVIGFLCAVRLMERLGHNVSPNSHLTTNGALYALMAGLVGARLFFVIHYFDDFRGRPLSVFAIWDGGLELLGGVLLATIIILFYLKHQKLPIRRYLDILAIVIMAALAFGRIGCFFSGCCFGKPTNLPWAVRFPYDSFAYRSQVNANLLRNRPTPQLQLPLEYFNYIEKDNLCYQVLKPYKELTDDQKKQVDNGLYRALSVHPTQLYESASAAFCGLVLYLIWRRKHPKPGHIFSFALLFYGIVRFFIEFLRDDNPLSKFDGLTISQHICIVMVVVSVVLIGIFAKLAPDKPLVSKSK